MSYVYFAKININKDIYKVYDKKTKKDDILSNLMDQDWQAVQYDYFIKEKDETGNNKSETVKFISIDKFYDERYIVGRLVKIYKDDIHLYDKALDDIEDLPQKDLARSVAFYFDLNKEIVAFVNKQKLTYRKFIELFEKLINLIYGEEMFVVILKKNNIEFQKKIKIFDNIKRIEISLIPPNSSSEEFSDLFPNSDEEIKESNITNMNFKYSSRYTEEGLNIDSPLFLRAIDATVKGWGEMSIHGKNTEGQRVTVVSSIHAPYRRSINTNERDSFEAIKNISLAGISDLMNN